jgi:hypothetical protein
VASILHSARLIAPYQGEPVATSQGTQTWRTSGLARDSASPSPTPVPPIGVDEVDWFDREPHFVPVEEYEDWPPGLGATGLGIP